MEDQILVNRGKSEYQDEPWHSETKEQKIKIQIAAKLKKRIAKAWESLSLRFQISFSKLDHPAYYHDESYTPDLRLGVLT